MEELSGVLEKALNQPTPDEVWELELSEKDRKFIEFFRNLFFQTKTRNQYQLFQEMLMDTFIQNGFNTISTYVNFIRILYHMLTSKSHATLAKLFLTSYENVAKLITPINPQAQLSLGTICNNGLEQHAFPKPNILPSVYRIFEIPLDLQLVLDYTSKYLIPRNEFLSLVSFIELSHQQQVQIPWPYTSILDKLGQKKEWQIAQTLIEKISSYIDVDSQQQYQHHLIQLSINTNNFKMAYKFVRMYNLREAYPTVERTHKENTLRKLCSKMQWSLAVQYVGQNEYLQKYLLQRLLDQEEYEIFDTVRTSFPTHEEFNQIQLEKLLKEKPSPDISYFDIPDLEIVFVDKEEQVAGMKKDIYQQHFDGQVPVVGLDVEWKAVHRKGQRERASILQLGTKAKAFVIDLMALEHSVVLESFLLDLFCDSGIAKLGFGFKGDLKVLARSYPEKACFYNIKSLLEIDKVIGEIFTEDVRSLAKCIFVAFGKTLNKSMRMTNWELRPLSRQQLRYAALDAASLVLLLESMTTQRIKLGKPAMVEGKSVVCSGWGEDVEAKEVPWWMPHLKSIHHAYDKSDEAVLAGLRNKYAQPEVLEPPAKTLPVLTTMHVRNHLEGLGCNGQTLFVEHEEAAAAYSVAESIGCEVSSIGKSICIVSKGKPAVFVTSGSHRLDLKLAAGLLKNSRRKTRLADANECINLFGYAPGTVPAFAHREPMPTFIDKNLSKHDYVYTGTGALNMSLRCKFEQLVELTDGTIAEFILQEKQGTTQTDSGVDFSSVAAAPAASAEFDGSTAYRFLADSMMGRLGRWLRMLGLDILQWTEADGDKNQLIAKSIQEKRILLTRDRSLAMRRDAGACYLVHGDNTVEQFHEVQQHFGLTFNKDEFMSRCSKCNSKGFIDLELEDVRKRSDVKPKVIESITEFYACRECDQLYWEGPKYNSAYANLSQLCCFKANPSPPSSNSLHRD